MTMYRCHTCGYYGSEEMPDLTCAQCGESRSQIERIEVVPASALAQATQRAEAERIRAEGAEERSRYHSTRANAAGFQKQQAFNELSRVRDDLRAAEAEASRYREALTRITNYGPSPGPSTCGAPYRIARAALSTDIATCPTCGSDDPEVHRLSDAFDSPRDYPADGLCPDSFHTTRGEDG
jgi:Zn finger protein HypA/HybF involved in hydrogenase expression